MGYLIGTDEAGYGPNLGPLVISASVWRVPDGVEGAELYRRLRRVVCCVPDDRQSARVAIADSKALYSPGKGLRNLERGLWAAWGLLDQCPRTCADVWRLLAVDCDGQRQAAFCHLCDSEPVPLDADWAEMDRMRLPFRATLDQQGVALLSLRSRTVFPDEFNCTVADCGSKGAALSRWTLQLVAEALAPLDTGPISIICDKHGGRDYYLPLLMEHFTDCFIEVRSERPRKSVYRFGPAERRVEISFEAGAESHLPTALASMASKYLRELAMRALNAFWRARLPELRPTAGYPGDARRFKEEITPLQRELKIDDHMLWRMR
jgi:hypothetical protein